MVKLISIATYVLDNSTYLKLRVIRDGDTLSPLITQLKTPITLREVIDYISSELKVAPEDIILTRATSKYTMQKDKRECQNAIELCGGGSDQATLKKY